MGYERREGALSAALCHFQEVVGSSGLRFSHAPFVIYQISGGDGDYFSV